MSFSRYQLALESDLSPEARHLVLRLLELDNASQPLWSAIGQRRRLNSSVWDKLRNLLARIKHRKNWPTEQKLQRLVAELRESEKKFSEQTRLEMMLDTEKWFLEFYNSKVFENEPDPEIRALFEQVVALARDRVGVLEIYLSGTK